MNLTNKKLIRIRRSLNNKYGRRVNKIRDEKGEFINIETVRKVRDKNSKNVKNLLLKIKNYMKDPRDESTSSLINEAKEQIIFLQEKNKKLSSDLIEKINRIRSLYQNNKNLWTDIVGSLDSLYEDAEKEDDKPLNTLTQSSNPYTTFNFLHKELIQ